MQDNGISWSRVMARCRIINSRDTEIADQIEKVINKIHSANAAQLNQQHDTILRAFDVVSASNKAKESFFSLSGIHSREEPLHE